MGVISEYKNREKKLKAELQEMSEEIQEKDLEIQKLRAHLAYLIRQKFGTKSERYKDLNQLSLFDMQELLVKDDIDQEIPKEDVFVESTKREKRKPKRKAIPAEFPRRDEYIEPENLPEGAIRIGEEITEKLEYTPGEFWVRRIIRPKYLVPTANTTNATNTAPTSTTEDSDKTPTDIAKNVVSAQKDSSDTISTEVVTQATSSIKVVDNQTANDDTASTETTIIVAPLPSFAIDKGIAGSTLLAYLIISKYCDHIPFYRIAHILKRSGLVLPESTINGWFKKVAELLTSLYEELKKQTLSSTYLQGDETTIQVQHEKPGSTHTGYYWVFYAPRVGTLFFGYDPGRGNHVPRTILKDFTGVLQTDGYAGYENLIHKDKITRLACMAHARRYFEKAKDEDPDGVKYVLTQIQRLYAVERQIETLDSQTRYDLRQKHSVPILKEMENWMEKKKARLIPKSLLSKAIVYSQNFWDRLCAYTQDGDYLIDNNPIENKIRPVALGRKNYLFAGSDEAAQNAAVMYSLLAACKINDVDPYKWLKDILEKLPDYKANKISDLLPANWKE